MGVIPQIIFCHSEYLRSSAKKICLSVSTLLSIWIRVNGAKRVNDAPSTTFNHLKTTCSNYRKVIPTYEWLAWLCLFFELLSFCKRPRNDSHVHRRQAWIQFTAHFTFGHHKRQTRGHRIWRTFTIQVGSVYFDLTIFFSLLYLTFNFYFLNMCSSSLPERGVITKKTEFHNPLPDLEDEREYHQIPL